MIQIQREKIAKINILLLHMRECEKKLKQLFDELKQNFIIMGLDVSSLNGPPDAMDATRLLEKLSKKEQ